MKTECAAPAPANQRELVRLLYLEHGHQRASEISGVRYDLVRKWASLGNWKQLHKPSQSPIQKAIDNVAASLAEDERETRLSLSRSARKLATEAEGANLRQAGDVHKVAQLTGIVHKWDNEKQGATFSLNVLNLNMFSDDSTPSVDA